MIALVLLLVCLALGWLIARYAHPPIGLAPALNWWLIYIAVPAMVLNLVPHLQLDVHMLYLVISQYLVFALAWLFWSQLGRRRGWPRARIGALILVTGLGNTSFIGYPLVEALRGQEGLALAVVADQAGCFVAMAVGGSLVAALYSGQTVDAGQIARKVLMFPAFLSLLVGLGVGALGGWPVLVDGVLARIAATLTPLALFSVGLRFKLHLDRERLTAVLMGTGWKLVVVPALILGAGLLLGARGLSLQVAVLEAAMGPMVTAAIIADQHHLDPPVANTLLGLGTLLCFISVPSWGLLLGGF